MIIGLCHQGSGIGNQLFRAIQTRVLALDKGFEYSIAGRENFKAKSFIDFDFGEETPFPTHIELPAGKLVVESEWPLFEERTNYYNPETNFIEDNSIIDGEFQDERYFEHRLGEIDQWLKVEPIEIPDDVCVIGFRGGEFAVFPELFLPSEYWADAMEKMMEINVGMKFEVHTDDVVLAEKFFGGPASPMKIIHDVGINWRAMRYAKYAIIANSSFYILPRLLKQQKYQNWDFEWVNEDAVTIAPRWWARHNAKEWSMPQNYYSCFSYI